MAKPENQQFQADPRSTAIAIAYRNPDYTLIADEVLPRVPVGLKDFKYLAYNEAEMFTVPDTRVGSRSAPNQVEIEGEETPASCQDFGIDIPLDNDTIKTAESAGHKPRDRAIMRATSIVQLDREIRVAATVSNAALYHNDQKLALAGASMFTDPASDPVGTVQSMLDAAWMRPNQLVFGFSAWSAFRKHPKVVKAINKNDGGEGLVTREQVAALFEVRRILVGEGRVNVAKPGIAPQMARVWGSIVAGQFIDSTVSAETGGITFGFTAQYGTRIAGSMPVNIGLRGGELFRSGETVKELIVAKRAGFLITNVA